LLLKQIQDKNSQIEQLKMDKTTIEKSKKTIATQLSQLKSKVNSLIN
jgi:chaperonin cofactor prefoldin